MGARPLVAAVAISTLAYALVEYAVPIGAAAYFASEYKDLMFRCDQVMREHYIAKRAVQIAPSELAVRNLEAAELGLLDCHEYDKMRKHLLVLGVSEPALASLGIEALESKAYDLRRFVEIHEIRY